MAPCSLLDGPDSGSTGGHGAPAAQALAAGKLEIWAWSDRCRFYCPEKAAEQLQDLVKRLGYDSSRGSAWSSGIHHLDCYFAPKGGPCEFLAAVLPVLLRGGLRLAAPAALADAAAVAGGGSPSLEVALQEAWRAKPENWLSLALLPLAPAPVLGGSAAAAGVVVIWLGEDGFVESVTASQPLHAEVLQRMPWINRYSWVLNDYWHEHGRFSITTLLAVVLPAMTHCGRELVAPQGLVERDRASEGTGPRADAAREAEVRTANGGKLPLVFFPRPEQALVEIQWDADEGPPGDVALELKASGADVVTEAPPAVRRVLEEACPWLGEEGASLLRGISAEFSPRVHEAVVSSIRQLGYEPVPAAGPVSTRCLFRSAQALREEERHAQAASTAEAEAVAQQAEEQQQALRAELVGALNALEEERAAREACEADRLAHEAALQAEAEQAELQAEEQHRALQAELEEASRALEAQKADHLAQDAALRAQAEQAVREARDQQQNLRAELQEALDALAAQKADCLAHETALRADAEQASLQAEKQQRAFRAELDEASRALEEQKADHLGHEAALQARAEQEARHAAEHQQQQQALRAELQEALGALEPQKANHAANGAAQAEQAARQAEEQQRALRAELEAASTALEAQKVDQAAHEAALRALAEEQQQALRSELEEMVRALGLQKASQSAQPEHEEARAAPRATTTSAEQLGARPNDWPSIQVQDADGCASSTATRVRVDCPGADEVDVSIEDVGVNGVHLLVKARAGSRDFQQDLWFERPDGGWTNPGPHDIKYERGALTLLLRRMSPKRMKLKFAGPGPSAPATQEVRSDSRLGSARGPERYDIASPANGADSQSIASEPGSWEEVGGDEHTAGLVAELGASSAGEDSAAGASHPTSWARRSAATAPPCGSPPAPASEGSGAGSAATVLSVASAPARGSSPCCFLPETAFRSAETGRLLRAAELHRAGGEKLLGPGRAEVLVRSAVKQSAVERDVVKLRLKGVSGSFVVTADHRLMTRGLNGEPVTCYAGDFVNGKVRSLYSGAGFHEVESAAPLKQSCQVVEVCFEGDAVALAWVLPRRARSSEARVPVAVPGKEPTLGDRGICERATFLHDSSPPPAAVAAACKRSRSAGAKPNRRSLWSAGTAGHDDTHPERCKVCDFHQLYLKGLQGPDGGRARPCDKGAACRRCHAAHPEYRMGGPRGQTS